MSENEHDLIDVSRFCRRGVWSKDFTVAIPTKTPGPLANGPLKHLFDHAATLRDNKGAFPVDEKLVRQQMRAVDELLPVQFKLPPGGNEPIATRPCRVNACLCNRSKSISLTARVQEPHPQLTDKCTTSGAKGVTAFSQESAGWRLTTEASVRTLWRLFQPEGGGKRPEKGLVLFAGGTGSGKSKLAQPFVLHHILNLRSEGKRPPHLVTVEDPIEDWSLHRQPPAPVKGSIVQLSPQKAVEYGFNLTSREVGKDVASLRAAIADAKRQTPSCLYVGEVRDPDDWTEAIEFAGSGHLIVVTTHAGSLSEAIGRLMHAVGAKTPATRGWVASRILGCVHMEGFKPSEKERATRPKKHKGPVFIPSVWIGSGQAVNDLIADGLSSVVPNGGHVLGRQQFVARTDAGTHPFLFRDARAMDMASL